MLLLVLIRVTVLKFLFIYLISQMNNNPNSSNYVSAAWYYRISALCHLSDTARSPGSEQIQVNRKTQC